ncbi:MAG: aminopeptidase N [Hydrogenovibrio sp.]|nr:aminopeptidase N [Hydrogenovibrio sp.]
MTQQTPQIKYLKDYQPLSFQVNRVDLTFELSADATVVTNRMSITRLNDDTTVMLDGEHLTLLSIEKDGVLLSSSDYQLTPQTLTLECSEQTFDLVIRTQVNPEANTRLEGLYRSSGNYCTQCEAEGFRTITYFFDRPDCLTYFTTKIIGDQDENKVLLSNGNLVEFGELEGNRHYAVWEDPYKKPCYLFALVAGNLEVVESDFITRDGRRVDLRLYVQANNLDKCEHAMTSLKKSMKWDEDRFGLVYDLDVYMIVAVDDFNMGAMENKGLNIFNSKYVLAKPETATDVDFEGIEAVIGHEYFHNWTGNRVTCRDWFQLTLKEGLTVFRDQEFTADMLSPAVKRIEDVKRLRSNQFPEDDGPMAHPIQPQSYIEMNNFYTMTVYEKGAEVVRLYHTLLGEEGFRKGMDLYFQRFDGQAVTVEDFRNAMADANQVDLSQMHNWYVQAGTPALQVTKHYDAEQHVLELTFEQRLKGQQTHQPLLIPVLFEMFNEAGEVVLPTLLDSDQNDCRHTDKGWLLKLTKMTQTLRFSQVPETVYLSLLRHFSAPVFLHYAASEQELKVLASHDTDAFVRWESIQQLALSNLMLNIERFQQKTEMQLTAAYAEAFAATLTHSDLDPALKSLALGLPDDHYLVEKLVEAGKEVDVDAVFEAIRFVQQALAEQFETDLAATYRALSHQEAYRYDKQAIAGRMLKNRCLGYLARLPAGQELALQQYAAQQNMTDVSAALQALKPFDSEAKEACLDDFYQRWQQEPLVLDKWFALQASQQSESALSKVKKLVKHPDFSYRNPNRVRSVLGVFGRLNMKGLHQADGEGYRFLASEVLKLDKINPQVAARIVAPFTQWHKFDLKRQGLMKQALQTIADSPELSKDVYEIVSKSLP